MSEITVRVLDEPDWPVYRTVRLSALEESPDSFTATLAEETEREEQFWRDRMTRAHRLLAERDQLPLGVVSVGPNPDKPSTGEVFGLYVFPEARGAGVAWRLVEEAAALAVQDGYYQLFYWVGVDNPRAIGFGQNFGFRVTGYRRQARTTDLDLGDDEVAMVFSLMNDDSAVPNPNSGKPAPREGPLR